MKSEELRIGNLYQNTKGQYKQITHSHIELTFYGKRKSIKPIELTEELLLKFGFKYEEAGVYGKSGWFIKIRNQDNPTFLFFNNHLQCSLLVKAKEIVFIDIHALEYVHHLQNLYFSLCGKELNLHISK
jgi:hypothetical protein